MAAQELRNLDLDILIMDMVAKPCFHHGLKKAANICVWDAADNDIHFIFSTDFLDYWLNSIHTHVHHAETGTKDKMQMLSQNRSDEPLVSPPVIIVCTKKDRTVSLQSRIHFS